MSESDEGTLPFNTGGGQGSAQFTAFCDGPASDNGFYGDGIVNALDAVRNKH